MQLRLDEHERVPIYTQIVEQVKTLVAAGLLRPGEQLPTVREVAAELRVNFNTVARAYRQLHDEGVISSQQGRGTYVVEGRQPANMARSREERLSGLVAGWLDEATRMGFVTDEVDRAWQSHMARRGTQEGSVLFNGKEE